jgi:hypothetical protein
MAEELTKNEEENTRVTGAPEPLDEVVEIDPADFVDPEEFGFRRLRVHE